MKGIVLGIALACGGAEATAADLMSVYQMASGSDPTLMAAKATRDATLEARPIARSQLLPLVSIFGDADYNTRRVRPASGGSYTDNFARGNGGIQLTQPIYRKDLNIQLEQADFQVAQAEIDYTIAEQDLIVRVTEAYFNVLSAQDTLTFTQADVKATERQLEQAKQRFEVGLIAITDVNEAQARYDQGRADEIVARNNVDDAMESLIEITGQPPGALALLDPQLPLNRPDPDSVEEWTTTALQNNPGIISAKYNADIAKKEIEFQDAGDSPTLDLVGSYGVSGNNSDRQLESNDGVIGVQLTIPLYTGGGVAAATRQARFQYEASKEQLEQQRRAVQTQVRNGYRGVLASISKVQALEATQISANSALAATEAGFEVGTRTLVDVLNSQRGLYLAKRDLAVARYDYILNLLSLLQANGTLSVANVEAANAWLEKQP